MFHNEYSRPFKAMYQCYSVSMLPGNDRHDLENGGKIIMPQSALYHLTRLNIVYPMLFKLTNNSHNRSTHCGVLEFVADEGLVYLPYWMMRFLLLEEGSFVHIENIVLPVATFSKFQPQSVDFLEICNQKAVLEHTLRNFACLTTGDVIAISYNDRIYELCVLETRPGPAVSIIECDMNVEFAPPVGYREPVTDPNIISHHSGIINEMMNEQFIGNNFVPFFGKGHRLDGKDNTDTNNNNASVTEGKSQIRNVRRGIPDDYQIGTLKFIRN